jgi:superfamily II DNA/RNA helicase
MLDMGFEKDIRAIVEVMREERQTMLFTATWPKARASPP